MKALISLSLLFSSFVCAAQTNTYQINWPKEYDPAKSKFFVHNEIEIAASEEKVWSILMEAEAWPTWYKGASNVSIVNSKKATLESNTVFTWKTMSLDFESTVKEFQVPYRLSWESKKKSIQGYHAWLIIPTAEGCRVITDESQNGWLTFFEKIFQRKKLSRLHEMWLQGLKKNAEISK